MSPVHVTIDYGFHDRENKLFIGMLPKTFNEENLYDIFVVYGELKEVHIIRGPDGSSKGCAFIKYVDRESALVAIDDMHEAIPGVCSCLLVILCSLVFICVHLFDVI